MRVSRFAIREEGYFSRLQDLEMGWRGCAVVVYTHTHTHKKKLYLRKGHFFVIEKHTEDVKQDEKHVPDLLEPIMRPTDPVKEELRRKIMKMNQFRPKINKIRVSTFWIPEI